MRIKKIDKTIQSQRRDKKYTYTFSCLPMEVLMKNKKNNVRLCGTEKKNRARKHYY